MRTTRLIIAAAALFTFCVFAEGINPIFAPVAVANAEAEGPTLKLKKAAKLHVGPSGPSKVLEIVFKNEIGIWMDKEGPWVQMRMEKNGSVGWIHHNYLKPATTRASAPASFSAVDEQGVF